MEGMTFSQGYRLWDGYDVQRWAEESLRASRRDLGCVLLQGLRPRGKVSLEMQPGLEL